MSAILAALFPALIPAVADGLRGLFAKFTGGAGAQPSNVNEVIQLMNADTARLQALAKLDEPGNVHMWVADLRALQRPIATILIILAYLYCLSAANALPVGVVESVAQYAQMVTFYLFGDRSYMYLRKK